MRLRAGSTATLRCVINPDSHKAGPDMSFIHYHLLFELQGNVFKTSIADDSSSGIGNDSYPGKGYLTSPLSPMIDDKTGDAGRHPAPERTFGDTTIAKMNCATSLPTVAGMFGFVNDRGVQG